MARRILLVEDDDTLRSLLQTILERSGFRVVAADCLATARVELLRAPMDLIVLDEVLPDGSGLEFVGTRRHEGWSGPVIMVTGFEVDLERANPQVAPHISAVLQKPVSGRDLISAIRAALPDSVTPTVSALDANRQPLLSGFAAQLGERIGRLAIQIENLRRGGGKPRATQRYARKVVYDAQAKGFPGLARVVERIESEIADLAACGDTTSEEHHRRLGLLLGQAHQAVPVEQNSTVATPRVRGFLVVQPDAHSAVQLVAEGNRQGLPITVVPHEAEAVRVGALEPILGVLLTQVTQDAVHTASRIRANSGNPNLLIALMPDGPDSELARVLDGVPGAMVMSRSIPPEAIVATLIDALRRPGTAHLRAMVVDDDEVFTTAIGGILEGYGVDVAVQTDPTEFTSRLATVDPDVVLLDVQMQGLNGFDLCRMLRANPRWRDLPVIFITAGSDRAIRAKCFEVGGNDFLQKPIIPQEMWARIQTHVATARVRSAESRRDPVTGLGARAGIFPLLQRLIGLQDEPVAIGLVSIVGLKSINHSHGYDAGDRALQRLGRAVGEIRTPGVSSGRWSDSEVLVALPQLSLVAAERLLNDLADRYSVEEITPSEGRPFVAECRGAVVMSTDGESLNEILALLEMQLHLR